MIKSKPLLYLLLTSMVSSCSKQESGNSSPGSAQPIPEIAECNTSTNYASSAYITGSATFSKRGLNVTHSAGNVTRLILSQNGISSGLPIRYAEIRVTDSAGSTVQCGRTNASGDLKALDGTSNLVIPPSAGSYTVTVYSRANSVLPVLGGKPNFNFVISVKNDVTNNGLYSISSSVSSSGAGAVATSLSATHSESVSSSIEGGAFNIYNSILTAYDYLAYNTGTLDLTCINPKLDVYWKAGFNPAQYIYPSADPGSLGTVSYYIKGQNQMYINGGRLGNVSNQDTDHFDDAVIIHELGHHIEDVCGAMDSPGGTHNGQFRIDPRLAWSEGWGNFFGAHVIRNKLSEINQDLSAALPASGWLFYYDSEGYGTTTGFEYIRINLGRVGTATSETLYVNPGNTGSVTYDQVNSGTRPGESHFREVSIARGLFKGTNNCTNCTGSNYFTNYWQALEKNPAGIGMGKSIYPFRSSIKYIDRIRVAQGGTLAGNLNTLFTTDEALQPIGHADYISGGNQIWIPYAVKLVPSGGPCSVRIQPRRTNLVNETNIEADQRFSNHFFLIDKASLPGVTTINMTAAYVSGSTVDMDLVLFTTDYLFNQDHQKNSSGDVISNNKTYPEGLVFSRDPVNSESVSISSLSSSEYYLLNVRAYSSSPNTISSSTEYSYTLTDQSGGNLCPASSF